ncbi:MAG: TIGR02147 family protein [Fibrobacterales bacterium]
MSDSINIFQYTDYRLFLKDAIQARKSIDKKFSQRFIHQKLGIKSTGWLADILGGRKKISRSNLITLAGLLSVGPREELYLQTLVDYNHSKTVEDKNRNYAKLLTFQEVPKDIIGKDRFEYFSKWHYAAIREYLFIEPFNGNYTTLSKAIIPEISISEAKAAIVLLEELGMIKRYAGGIFKPAVEHVKKQGDSFAPVYYYNYLKAQMELGIGSMERIPKEERDISAVSATLSEEAFKEIAEDIKVIRKKIVRLSEEENGKFWNSVDGDSRRVYQGVFELFPVSKVKGGR